MRTVIYSGIDHDVGLVVACARKQIGGFLTRVVGKAQIRVAIAGVNLQTTKPVDQENVHHTGHGVSAINGRGAVLQNIDVIN